MINRKVLLITWACSLSVAAVAQNLNIVVPVIHERTNSRPAHFNWTFQSSGGGDVRMGQFACGSYWVAPAAGDTGVRVLSLGGNPAWNDLVSCDADPLVESHGLLSGAKNYGNYSAAENIIPNLPQTFAPVVNSCISLVAAMQRNEAETSNGGTSAIVGEVADAYCVVTILAQAPANEGSDMIRPNITGTTKELLTWDDFDLERIPTYSFINAKTASSWEQSQRRWTFSTEIFGMFTERTPRSWNKFSEGGRAFRAHIVVPDYGAGTARLFNDDVLALFSAAGTLEQKKVGLAAMLAYGLDLYHARYDYGSGKRKAWASGAGQSPGAFLPTVLVAALQKDETKAHELRKAAIYNHDTDVALQGPAELRQQKRGMTGVLLWGDGQPFDDGWPEGKRRYWSEFRGSACFDGAVGDCSTSSGQRTSADPYGYHDGPAAKPGAAYMAVAFGPTRALAAAMILMPEIRSIVNTDDPIEYADRAMRHGLWTAPDPVAVPSVEAQQNSACDIWRSQFTACTGWESTWGRDPTDYRFAIEGGAGRFTSLHGTTFSSGTAYESSEARTKWTQIIALYDGPRFEDSAVDLGVTVAPEILFETGANPRAHIRCATQDAQIRYTLDGSEPTASSPLYTGPVSVANGVQVRAKAFTNGYLDSAARGKTFEQDTVELPLSWGGHEADERGFVDTGNWLGWLYVEPQPWVWSQFVQSWMYSADGGEDPDGAWMYLPYFEIE